MLTVLVANIKGGCGKTTIATHLAAAFATAGQNTLLADVDRQKSSLGWVDRRPADAAPLTGLDWSKDLATPPKGSGRAGSTRRPRSRPSRSRNWSGWPT